MRYDVPHMSEIPVSVLVPPDGLTEDGEVAWGEENRGLDPSIQVAEPIDIGREVLSDFDFYYSSLIRDVRYAERAKLNAVKEARKWDNEATGEKNPESRERWLKHRKGWERDAAKAAREARSSRESATFALDTVRRLVEGEVCSLRQTHWGDTEMPDLGLDFSAYEGLPDESILSWSIAQYFADKDFQREFPLPQIFKAYLKSWLGNR